MKIRWQFSVAAASALSRQQGHQRAGAIVFTLAALLGGCGQKGPLTLPPAAASASAPAAAR